MAPQRQARHQRRPEVRRRQFDLQNTNTPGKNFWFAAAQQEYCYNPVTFQPVLIPQKPQNASVDRAVRELQLPDRQVERQAGTNGPSGRQERPPAAFQRLSVDVHRRTYWQPRIGIDVSRSNPDTVLRGFGRPLRPRAAELRDPVQQRGREPGGPELSDFCRTDSRRRSTTRKRSFPTTTTCRTSIISKAPTLSIKITPYYRYATQQLDENIFIPTLLAHRPSTPEPR